MIARAREPGLGLRPDYVRRLAPHVIDEHRHVRSTWTRALYEEAADLAREARLTTLVDLGCGNGEKLVQQAAHFAVIGIDTGGNAARCRRHSVGTWIEHDLSSNTPLPLTASERATAAFVCVDVLEHLAHPDTLLLNLRRAMPPGGVALVATPDREKTHGPDHAGPPPNPEHAQEWSFPELRTLLVACGFEAPGLRHEGTPERRTIVAVLRAE